jgi:hypothetical protein
MESKKINQLATELTPSLSDLTIIGDPSTGISKKITLSQMASLFTGTVEEYPNVAAFPLVGVADTIYIALDTNVLYRWNTGTNAYVELSPNIINSLVFNDANGFDGTIALVGSVATLTITTALTTGSVGFIGASGALLQDNANFFWDDTNNRLGLGTNAPTTALDAFGSGIIGRLNGTSTNNSFLGFASAGSNKWSIGNVQSDHRFRIYNEATTSELVSILSTGEFGIGIANPTTKFHIDGGASALIANLDANVSVAKSLSFRSDNSNRFNIEVSGTESGSNAGANLFIRRYSDAGALIDTPLTITRSTGVATFGTSIVIGSGSSNNSLNIFGSSGVGLEINETTTGTSKRLSLTQDSTSVIYNATFGSGGNQHVFQVGGTTELTIDATNSTFTNNLIGTSASFSSTINALSYSLGTWKAFDNSGAILRIGGINASNWTQLDFYTSGTNKFSIATNGAATFSSSITAGGRYFATTSVNDNILEVINTDTTNGYGLFVRGGGTASGRYVARFKNAADSDVMWVGNNGNVLIGTTTDNGATLQVQGIIDGSTFSAGKTMTVNANNERKSGMYRWNDASTNLPESGFFAVTVYGNGDNVVAQIATHFQNGNTYVRAYNTSWTSWKRLD